MIIQNNQLKIHINSFGAEIRSVVKDDIEYIWQADPAFWKRSSPVLFPFVGKLTDDEYIYENKTYSMGQHGFARDNEFTLIESTDTKAVYMLQETIQSLQSYPFKFTLLIGYEVINNELLVSWTVTNNNETLMLFQIGAHPAFNFVNGSILDINKVTNHYQFKGTPHVQKISNDVAVSSITIGNDTFSDNALVFDNIDYIKLSDSSKTVEILCPGFPYMGIWSNRIDGINAPFICLEPWHGITDFKNHDKQLVKKKHMNLLSQNETFQSTYKIRFN